MVQDGEGFLYPKVTMNECVDCGKCERVCPMLNPAICTGVIAAYGAYRKDFDRRLKSQSGGVFAVLAERVLGSGGVVVGAIWNEDWSVRHFDCNSADELDKLLGSKYVQSAIGDSYVLTEGYLKAGKPVLFCGTPCQGQGLRKYLSREYEQLVVVDLICHGVASPGVWEDYLEDFVAKRKLVSFTQKDKARGNAIVYEFSDGSVNVEGYDSNLFSKGYSNDLFLRSTCYDCRFKGFDRCSDLTLGDFWGIERLHTDFGDKYGVSAVLVHTEKGHALVQGVADELELIPSDRESILRGNPSLCESSSRENDRSAFFRLRESLGTYEALKKLFHVSPIGKFSNAVQSKVEYAAELIAAIKRRIKTR